MPHEFLKLESIHPILKPADHGHVMKPEGAIVWHPDPLSSSIYEPSTGLRSPVCSTVTFSGNHMVPDRILAPSTAAHPRLHGCKPEAHDDLNSLLVHQMSAVWELAWSGFAQAKDTRKRALAGESTVQGAIVLK
jgi:hypothetical protein